MKMSLKPLAAATLLALASHAASASSDRYVIQVDDSKKGLVKALVKQLGGDINLESNGFLAATFSGKDLEQVKGLLNNPHIKLVEQDQVRRLMAFSDDLGDPAVQQITPYAVYQSQADQLTLQMQNAKKVCVIDSGIARETGETGGYNPDFDWSSITGDSDAGTNDWFRDGGPHGTHVAGTIAAADNSYGVIGMAPGNPLHIIKVFNDAGWGYSSDLAHAANLCSQAGANIISMSLGGGGANSTEENAFKVFTEAGGLVVAAAGNDGNNVRSYPAGYSSVMMVGANDANNNIADFSQFPSCTTGRGKRVTTDETVCVEVTAGGVDTLSTYPGGGATLSSMSADGVDFASAPMENVGSASGQTFFMGTAESPDAGAAGKICVIDRGVISFHDKVANCEASGGIGAVIINNVAGMLYGTLGDTASNSTSIPAVGAALEDRAALLAASSATVDVGAADYGYMSGTSMATPAVSGVAALVWSNHPQCTGSEIRQALKATALDAGAPGKDEYFGYGIVQAKAASDYLAAQGCAGGNGGGGDNGGGEPGALDLTAYGYKVRGYQNVDLSWSGANGSSVDVYRDGAKIATTANDGAYTDSLNVKGTASYTYQVCEAGSSTCSVTVSVIF